MKLKKDLDIPKKLTLYDYQQDIINQINEKIKNGEHNIFIQSSAGSGKTLMMSEMVRQYSQKYHVLSIAHRQEIINQTIRRYAAQGANMENTDVAMIQTAVRHLDRYKKPKLIITDEAHHIMANSYIKTLNHFDDDNIIKLYFSATPWRADGQGFTSLIPEENLILGPTTQYLIDHNYLSDFDYYQPQLLDESLLKFSKRTGEYTNQSVHNAVKSISPELLVDYYEQLGQNKQGIVYAASVESSKAIVDEFNQRGIVARHLDGNSDKEEREQIIENYRQGKIKILSNVEIFTEGLDLPNATVALIARPTMSLSLYIQFTMRVLRPMKNKRAIILDFVGNAEKLGLPSSDFNWTLRSHEVKSDLNPGLVSCKHCHRIFKRQELLTHFVKEVDEDDNEIGYLVTACPVCHHVMLKKPVGTNDDVIGGSGDSDEDLLDDKLHKISNREEFEQYWLSKQELDTSKSLLMNFKILEAHKQNLINANESIKTEIDNVSWKELLENVIRFFYEKIHNLNFTKPSYNNEMNKLITYINNKYHEKLTISELQKMCEEIKVNVQFEQYLETSISFDNDLNLNIKAAAAQAYYYKHSIKDYYMILFDSLLPLSKNDFLKLNSMIGISKNIHNDHLLPNANKQLLDNVNNEEKAYKAITEIDLRYLINDKAALDYYYQIYNRLMDDINNNRVGTLESAVMIRYRTGSRGIKISFNKKHGELNYYLFTNNFNGTFTAFSAKDVCNILYGKNYSHEQYRQIKNTRKFKEICNQILEHKGEKFYVDMNNNDRKVIRFGDLDKMTEEDE